MCFLSQKLEFTVGEEEPRSPDAKSMPMDKVQDELDRLIVTENTTNEAVFDWVEVRFIHVRQ